MGKQVTAARQKQLTVASAALERLAIAANDNEWIVELADGVGRVRHTAKPIFACRFVKLTRFEIEEAEQSQDFAFNDAQAGRMFYDFEWPRLELPREPELSALLNRMARAVQMRVGRR